MVENWEDDLYSTSDMGRAMFRGLGMYDERGAIRKFDGLMSEEDPDYLVLQGAPNEDISADRAKGVATNAYAFGGEGDLDAEIVSPIDELRRNEELIHQVADEYDMQVHVSDDQIDRALETAYDDVSAVSKLAEEGDRVFHHTSSAHARAAESAYETIERDLDYVVFGFGSDPFSEHVRQSVNAILQQSPQGRTIARMF